MTLFDFYSAAHRPAREQQDGRRSFREALIFMARSTRGNTQGRFSAGLPLVLRESTLQRLHMASGMLAWSILLSEALTLFEITRGEQPFYWGVHLSRLAMFLMVLWIRPRLIQVNLAARQRLRLARIGIWALAFCLAFQECYYWPAEGKLSPAGLSRVGLVASLAPVLIPDRLRPSLLYALSLLLSIPLAHYFSLLFGLPPVALGDLFLVLARHLVSVGAAWIVAATVNQLREAISSEYGSYKLQRKLGQGGFGEVWEATHRHHQRAAAIKIIRRDCDEEACARFMREAQTLSGLECPHTVRLYDYGSSESGQLYLVMERLRGIDLDQLVKTYGPQEPERVTSILTQACLALEEAHGRGLIHRDIKPANIFLCRVGVEPDFVKLLDFGLVKPSQLETDLTHSNALLGTPDFMSPEQIQGLPVSEASDLYSLAAVGYFLLTGGPLFPSRGNPMEVLSGHLSRPPQPPSQRLGKALPQELESILLQCLKKHPGDRFPDARALYENLIRLPRWQRSQASAWWAQHPTLSST